MLSNPVSLHENHYAVALITLIQHEFPDAMPSDTKIYNRVRRQRTMLLETFIKTRLFWLLFKNWNRIQGNGIVDAFPTLQKHRTNFSHKTAAYTISCVISSINSYQSNKGFWPISCKSKISRTLEKNPPIHASYQI